MSVLMHVYRMSDLMERIYHSAEPLLICPCNTTCHAEAGHRRCAHQSTFDLLTDLPLPIFAVHAQDLNQIPLHGYAASWGHALLVYRGQVVHHWPHIPTRLQLQAALDTLNVSLQKPRT